MKMLPCYLGLYSLGLGLVC